MSKWNVRVTLTFEDIVEITPEDEELIEPAGKKIDEDDVYDYLMGKNWQELLEEYLNAENHDPYTGIEVTPAND